MDTNVSSPPIPQRNTVIKVMCAWCGKFMGTKPGEGVEGISGSICPECEVKFSKEVIKHG